MDWHFASAYSDIYSGREDAAMLLESCLPHTHNSEGNTWSALELPAPYEPGFVNIDGYLYYVKEDGYFLKDDNVGELYFGADGRYSTGDADLVWLAGDEYILGSEKGIFKDLIENNLDKIHSDGDTYDEYECDHMMQPVSLFFVMRGVDFNTASKLNNKNLYFGDLGITKERFEQWEFAGTPGFEITSDYVPMPQNRVLVSRGRHKDEAVINMSRIININGADADDLSRGEVMAQLQLIAIVDFLKTFIPGFEKSYLVETSTRLGVRETRRLCGKYKIQGNDLINCKKFDDAICKGFYMIDIHDPQGKRNAIGGEIKGDYFEIPYGALCSKNFSNLLACGRCISSDHIAHSATRIQGTCILTGQAAGCAAALSKEENIPPCDLNVHILRAKLAENNVNLH